MKINMHSLSLTVDSVNEAFFFQRPIQPAERDKAAAWIASRQGLPGAYADMFAPTPAELKGGVRLFTCERIGPSASLRHVSGEEACRALILLKSPSREAQAALERATAGMRQALKRARGVKRDFFCCGTCDPALWRHLSAGGLIGEDEWIAKGMRALRVHRDGAGKWRRFQFFFTLLALSELDSSAARQEMKYAVAVCERYLKRAPQSGVTSERRRAVVERVLARC